jgi:hypothetical protein
VLAPPGQTPASRFHAAPKCTVSTHRVRLHYNPMGSSWVHCIHYLRHSRVLGNAHQAHQAPIFILVEHSESGEAQRIRRVRFPPSVSRPLLLTSCTGAGESCKRLSLCSCNCVAAQNLICLLTLPVRPHQCKVHHWAAYSACLSASG